VSPSETGVRYGQKQRAGSRDKVNVKRVHGAKRLGTYGSDPMSMGWPGQPAGWLSWLGSGGIGLVWVEIFGVVNLGWQVAKKSF